jgi:hypothetical protein
MSQAAIAETSRDRRSGRRYALRLPVTFKIFRRNLVIASGMGDLFDISSRGAAFTSSETFAFGTTVELAISWPALLHGVTHIKLVLGGTVIRSDEGLTALEIDRYEFRTQKCQ